MSEPRLLMCADGMLFDHNGYCPKCGAGEADTCGGRDGVSFPAGTRVVELEAENARLREALQKIAKDEYFDGDQYSHAAALRACRSIASAAIDTLAALDAKATGSAS